MKIQLGHPTKAAILSLFYNSTLFHLEEKGSRGTHHHGGFPPLSYDLHLAVRNKADPLQSLYLAYVMFKKRSHYFPPGAIASLGTKQGHKSRPRTTETVSKFQ